MRSLVFGLSFSCLLATFPALAEIDVLDPEVPLENRLTEILRENEGTLKRANIAISFVDLDTSTVLFNQNASKLMTPASTLKSYTSSAAMTAWGPDHRFTTTLATPGLIENGTLKGDLFLVGGGDPMLTTEDYASMAKRLREEKGVTAIEGNLVLDVARFSTPGKGPGWMWDDEPDYYNMTISPLMMDFNVMDITVEEAKEGQPGNVKISTEVAFPPVEIIRGGSAGDVSIRRQPFQESITINVPAGKPEKKTAERIAVLSSDQWIGETFKGFLANEGVSLTGQVVISHVPTGGAVLLTHEGATLDETVRHFHKVSENAVGEMLLLNLAKDFGGKPGTWPDGAELITRWLTGTAHVPEGSFRIVDGSGLSRYNMISCDSSVALLNHMWHSPMREPWINTLTTYEVEMRSNAPAEISKERVHAKTGGMGSVTTLVGYVETEKGRWVAFSWLANGYIGSNTPISNVRKKMLAAVAAWDPDAEK